MASQDEAEIRALFDEAVRARDVDRLVTHYAPGVVSFDVIEPLRYLGIGRLRERAQAWLASFEGPLEYELRDLTVHAGDAVAFCHSLNRVGGTRKDGRAIEMWWRATVGLVKRDGQWVVAHAHSSVPFDPASGRASLDLEP